MRPAVTAGDTLRAASRFRARAFASSVCQNGVWPWDLLLQQEDRVWDVVTGARGRRSGGQFHNAIDVGAPLGVPIRFVGFVPWERATVVQAVGHKAACAANSPRPVRNAGSILVFQSVIGRVRVTRRVFHSDLGVRNGQLIRPGDVIGWVSDHGRTFRKGGRRGHAPHVHYEIWITPANAPPDALGENLPLSQVERRIFNEIQWLAHKKGYETSVTLTGLPANGATG